MRSTTEHPEGARAFLDAQPSGGPVWVVASTPAAARALVRDEARRRHARGEALSGWRATTLDEAASLLAASALDDGRLSQASPAAIAAIVLELVRERGSERLGRYRDAATTPSLVDALTRSLSELSQADVSPAAIATVDPVLAELSGALRARLRERRLVDRAGLFELAVRAAHQGGLPPMLLLEVMVASALDAALVHALARGSERVLAVVPSWDERTRLALGDDLDVVPAPDDAMRTVARELFEPTVRAHPGTVARFSARSEREECAEVVSRILALLRTGSALRDVAVVLADPAAYRGPIAEALVRAGLPHSPIAGARRPDPSGRALLALIDCALEGLSARAFIEYLSFGVLPPAESGAPPAAWAPGDRVGDDEDDEPADDTSEGPVRAGTLRSPYRFERVMVDAAVVGGGVRRWESRLAGLRERLHRALAEADEAEASSLAKQRDELAAFEAFALPLVHDLSELDVAAPLGAHIERLAALATRALARPRRVLAVLDRLRVTGTTQSHADAMSLGELRGLLDRPLRDVPSRGHDDGSGIEVLALDEVRGRRFDHVLLPGLSERAFPRPAREDPILPDAARVVIGAPGLLQRRERVLRERDVLRAVVGAARRTLTASHARTDGARGRARLPSLYLLELARAAEGRLPEIDEAAPPAPRGVLGAPRDPAAAIDATEHGLAELDALLAAPPEKARGRLRYLFDLHPALHRAVRQRYAREQRDREYSADGLVVTDAAGRALLARNTIGARAYSATALESFSACPYRFYLRAILRLSPREVLEPLIELDPLLRGSLVHSLQFRTLMRLREAGIEPSEASLAAALAVLDEEIVAQRIALAEQHLLPVPGALEEDLRTMASDARRWLEQLWRSGWRPVGLELSFGLAGHVDRGEHDPESQRDPVRLASGITLRGAIDLVEERDGVLRATDHKTGRARVQPGVRTGGGATLQPALYAEALEALPFARGRSVSGGRLWYCTSRGQFSDVEVPLDGETRGALSMLVGAIDEELTRGRLLRRPRAGECAYCDHQLVCGPTEASRAQNKKVPDALVRLRRAR